MSLTLITLCMHPKSLKFFVDDLGHLHLQEFLGYESILRICPACDGHNFSAWPNYHWEPVQQMPLAMQEQILIQGRYVSVPTVSQVCV